MSSCIVSYFLNGALEFSDYFLQHAFVHYSQITLHFLNLKYNYVFFFLEIIQYFIQHITQKLSTNKNHSHEHGY